MLIKEYPLVEGDELVFDFGEMEGNPAIMPVSARQHPFPVAVAAENQPQYRLVAEIPELTVTAAPARRFEVIAKPAVTRGEPFALQIVAAGDILYRRRRDSCGDGGIGTEISCRSQPATFRRRLGHRRCSRSLGRLRLNLRREATRTIHLRKAQSILRRIRTDW